MDDKSNAKVKFKDKFKEILARALKSLSTSAALVVTVAVISVIYAFFAHGRFWPAYIFTANLFVGAFLIMSGVVVFALPTYIRKSLLLDHTTHASMHLEAKAKKRERAYMLIYLGMGNVIITIIAQYLLSLIWR